MLMVISGERPEIRAGMGIKDSASSMVCIPGSRIKRWRHCEVAFQDCENRTVHFHFSRKFAGLEICYSVILNVSPYGQGEEFQVVEIRISFNNPKPSLRPVHGFCKDVSVWSKSQIERGTNLEHYSHQLEPGLA